MSSDKASLKDRFFGRLDTLYFVLAAFDLVTIVIALMLNHTTTTAFERAVQSSAALSARQLEIIQLSTLARAATAPGDDVFASGDVVAERARHLDAIQRFETALDGALVNFSSGSDSDRRVQTHLQETKQAMADVRVRADVLFDEFRAGSISRAGRNMAQMDRAFGVATRELEQALAVVNRLRSEQLEQQLRLARNLRSLEWVLGSALILIVSLVAFYGLHIGRSMRASQAQRNAMMRELATARDRLQRYADDVSHELRGQISKMRLTAEVLLQLDRSPRQYRDGVESILGECEHLSSTVESLLFLARAENTQVALRHAPLDAKRELSIVAEFYSAAAERAGVHISTSASESLVLWADRGLFQRALSNLVNNALAHTPRGGRIELRAESRRGGVEISVVDNGPGMSPEMLDRAFDRFERGAGRPDGLGLGLAIVKSIMDLHTGTITLSSGGGLHAVLHFPGDAARPAREDNSAVISTQ